MTPLQISILLHYYARLGDFGAKDDNATAPAVIDSREWFVAEGLIENADADNEFQQYQITDRGRAYVEDGLMCVPLPEMRWKIHWPIV